MSKRSIGLDIGTNAVRAAEIRHGDVPVVSRLGQVALANGAVHEGEVLDPVSVASALKELWKEAQFEGKSVRVGVAPSRAIVRTIEVPDLPINELRSLIGFELSDHVPLDPASTTFGIVPLDQIESSNGPRRRVLLAAAPIAVVNPMIETIRKAGLRVEAVDVAPLALSRAFRALDTPRADGDNTPSVDAVISIGGETLLAVVAENGQLLFNRKAPSQAGSQFTARIQDHLSIPLELAEMAKRRIATDDTRHLLASVATMTSAVIEELADEIHESIDYYLSQLGSRPIDRILITGGGSLLLGLDQIIAERTGYPTSYGNPFEGLGFNVPGLEQEDCSIVSQFVASAIGYALGGDESAMKMDLQPKRERNVGGNRKLVLVAASLVGVAGLGVMYMGARKDISSIQDQTSSVIVETGNVTKQVEELRSQDEQVGMLNKGQISTVVTAAYDKRIDWTTSFAALDQISAQFGIKLDGFTGLMISVGEGDSGPTTAAGEPLVATVTFSGSAPNLDSIAEWIREVERDPRFNGVSTPSVSEQFSGDKVSVGYTFAADLSFTESTELPLPADAPQSAAAAPTADATAPQENGEQP